MSPKRRIELRWGKQIAEAVVEELRPGCERIEIAGSIRREQETVGDIEIVLIARPSGLFPQSGDRSLVGTELEETLIRLVHENRLVGILTGGDKLRRYTMPRAADMQLDLCITTAEEWPVIFAIRTGAWQYSKQLVTTRDKSGLLPDGHQVQGGRVWGPNGAAIDFADERAFLEFAGGWVRPRERTGYRNPPEAGRPADRIPDTS